MSELNRIKTVLFTAHSLNDALNKLDDLGFSYYESDPLQMWCITHHNIQFWPSESSRFALTVFADNRFHDYDDRRTFLAHQPEMAETSVPAASPDLAGEQPVIPEQSTESVHNRTITWPNPIKGMSFKSYPKTGGAA